MDTSFFAYNWGKNKKWDIKNEKWKKYIVVNLNKNAEKFLPQIIQEVKSYYNKWYAVYYVPIAKGKNSQYNDMQYIHKIQIGAQIKDQRFIILDREEDFENFIKILAQAQIVISSRLHLFLIASFLEIPTKVYPYQKKILKMQKTLIDMKII